MECSTIKEMLSAYIDTVLSSEEKKMIEEHLSACQKCSESLAELRKTVARLKGMDEVSPPAWLTQKIMTKVKEEALPKKRLLHRLFYPLHIKLPLEAFAMIAIAVITVYIFKTMPGEIKFTKAPTELPAPQISSEREVPSREDVVERDLYREGKKSRSPAVQKGKIPEKTGEDRSLSDEAAVPLSEFRYAKKPPPHKEEEQGIEEQKGVFQAQPSRVPVPSREPETSRNRYFSEYDVAKEGQEKAGALEAPAPAIAPDKIETFTDSAEVGETDRELTLAQSQAGTSDLREKPSVKYILEVRSIETALEKAEVEVIKHKGTILKKETYSKTALLTITIPSEQAVKFLAQLKDTGTFKGQPEISEISGAVAMLTLEIVEIHQ